MTFADYSRHQGVSYKTVANWATEKKIKLVSRGKVDVDVSDEMLSGTRGMPGEGGVKKQPPGPVDERAPFTSLEASRMKENYVALAKKLEFEREAGTLAPIAELEAAYSEELAILRTKLLAMGSIIGPKIVMLPDAEIGKAIVDAEINHVLEELKENARQTVEKLRAH